MSWSRFFTSDIYTFPAARKTANGVVENCAECCACRLNPVNEDTGWPSSSFFVDLDEFLAHIEAHKQAGHRVPPDLADLIADEWAEYIP